MRIIAGQYKNRPIQSPKGLKTRPTSGRLRESLFNICQGINEESEWIDLFAGSGAIGFEALSRGAKSVTFVDNSRESIRCIQSNAKLLGVEDQTEVIYGDVFDTISKLAKRGRVFDIIYADPPYEMMSIDKAEKISYSLRILSLIENSIENHTPLLASGGSLFLEEAVDALPNVESLSHLYLKSSRAMGRSALQHYART